MKKYLYAIAVFATVCSLSSCQQEIEKFADSGKVFSASIDMTEGTKAIIDDMKVKWENSDKINVNGIYYSATPDGTDARKALFTKDSGTDPVAPYTAIFPSSLYVASPSAHFVLPSEMTYAAGKFNMPMYAESSTTSLKFKNIFAVLKISVSSSVNVKSLAVSSDMYMNGTFTLSDNVASIVSGSDASKTTTLSCASAVAGTDFYIPIPAGDYSGKKLKVVLTKEDDSKETMTTNQSITISVAAGSIFNFNFKKDGLFVLGGSEKKITDKQWVL